MLDAFIIQEIKRREWSRQDIERPPVELPIPAPDEAPPRNTQDSDEEKPQRGIIILDL